MPRTFSELFAKPKPIIAMVHTGPSPGVPGYVCVESAVERAIAETEVYLSAGVDGLIIENMRDFPCVAEDLQGPEVVASLTRVACAVKRRAKRIPVGIQVLFQANKTAIAVAHVAGCDFIRAEGWTHAHVSDKGIATASAGEVVRYRASIGANNISVFADIKKKHASHAWTSDLGIGAIAETMELHQADAVIVTGVSTGRAANVDDLNDARVNTSLPVIVGSGVTHENLSKLSVHADGFIVGSAFKENGRWDAPVSEERVFRMIEAAETARAARTAEIHRN